MSKMSMKMVIIAVIIILPLAVGLTACTSAAPTSTDNERPSLPSAPTSPSSPSNPTSPTSTPPSGLIKATWIDPQVDGSSVSIPLSEVQDNWNIHFKIDTSEGTLNYMSYLLNETIYVRANVCPPCKSIGYSLFEDVLVCDRCATTFEADTGDGIDGACVDFPKAEVPYETVSSSIVMDEADLIAAYEDTLSPGWP